MDKVIRHRFWILLALVPILSIFGYYKANAALNAARQEREDKLNGIYSGVPSGTEANERWTKAEHGGLEARNAVLRQELNAQFVRLWNHQQERMVWPPEMVEYLPAEGYRGPFARQAEFVYRSVYKDEIDDLHTVAEPIVLAANEIRGKVFLDRSLIPEHQFDPLALRSEEIWNAQEDTWFTRLLLEAVRNVNEDAPNAAKSVVRKIYEIRLVGGDGESTVKKSGGGGGGGLDSMPGMAPGGMLPPGMGDALLPDNLDRGNAGNPTGADFGGGGSIGFDPSEEFGSEQKKSSSSGTNSGTDPAGTGGPGGPGGPLPGMNNVRRKQETLRYIDLDESAPFRERGFYLDVLIDQTKIADFLVELSNADWPIRIARFHVGPNPESGTGQGALLSGNFNGGFPDISGVGPAGPGMPADAAVPGLDGGADLFAPPSTAYGPSQMLTGEEFAGLLTHPDLVQLTVAGAITFYHPPPDDVLAALEADAAEATDGNEGETPAGEQPTGGTPETESSENAAPSTDDASTDDASTDDASTDDAAEGTEDPESPAEDGEGAESAPTPE